MIQQVEFRAMGCQCLVAMDLPDSKSAIRAEQRLNQVPAWFEGWEQALSRFRPESELSLLNQNAGQPVPVSQTLWDVYQAALQSEARSGGLVTPVVYDALVAAGYDRSFEDLLQAQAIPAQPHRAPAGMASLQAIQADPRSRTLHLTPGLHLDFGGVAKGWAVYQAAQRLKPYGPALVDAGGDISVSGLQSSGEPWPVGIANPLHPELTLAVLHLGRCGVATSGTDYRRWVQDGVTKHHIIDPRTGQPAETDVLSVTVIAPTIMEAETATKVILISGSQAGLDWLESRPTLAGLLVLESGQAIYSQRFEQYLRSI